ncbi:MAG TPA: ABC transporter ATP-binding protein, partial [Blastocatellia bacterium]|nr:ABC transporter ATP-binding protein [Blastocatellia bacterium]
DVEECCDEILILKGGNIAANCNLEEERRANKKFIEMETRNGTQEFIEAIGALGCDYAVTANQRVKIIMPEGAEVRDLYRLAAERNVQIRRLNYKRDSLEDIFLKAMEQ